MLLGLFNAKEVLTPKKGENLIFPIADGKVKLSGGDQVLRTSTLIRDRPDRGEEQGNLQGESDGSSSDPRQDTSPDGAEAGNDFLVHVRQSYLPSLHVEPRVKPPSRVRAERRNIPNSTTIHRRKQGNMYDLGFSA